MNVKVNLALVVAAAVLLVIGAAAEASAILWLSIACALIAFVGMVASARLARHREAAGAVAPGAAGWSAATAATTSSTATLPERERAEPEPAPTAETPTVVEPAAAPVATRRRRRRAFPIEGYDTMRVREVLPVLEDLDAEDLEVVRRHEVEGKNRTTVVRRADALLADLRAQRGVEEEEAVPIDDYDRMRVRDILPILDHLDPDDLELARRYETDTKNRPTIVRRIDQLLAAAEEAEEDEELVLEEVLEVEEEEEVLLTEEPVAEPEPAAEPEPEPVPVGGGAFPIEDYDQRRMGEILSIIEGLDEADLRLVAQREHQGQRRAVIINKIDALAPGTAAAVRGRPPLPPRRARTGRTAAPAPAAAPSGEPPRSTTAPLPIEGYDAMRVRDLLPRLDDLDVVQLEWVRRHEEEGKRRTTVLRRIEQLMALRQGGGAVEEEALPTARLDRAT
ncbi:MAG TPA: hypothetical protein VHE80_00375 [Acidimicrobiales bacterium]|nr:hypothetical protein [Acidimicrobiales bacterium]